MNKGFAMKFKELFFEQFRAWRPVEIAWMLSSLLAILALSLFWKDNFIGITAALTGMMYTVLAGKGKVSCFLFGLINTPLYAYISFKNGFYGDFSLNIFYFVMMFPGLITWGRNQAKTSEEGVARTRLTFRGRIILLAVCAFCVFVYWNILRYLGGNEPFCDSITNVLSIAAMLLTVRRAIEEWILWIVVNSVEVLMWTRAYMEGSGSISVLLMWLLFLANGIYILSLWLRLPVAASTPVSIKKHG
jgi:nicotinamide mononucleotide transporter